MDNFLVLNTKKYLGRKQIVLDCKFQIEAGKEVEKVLAVSGSPALSDTVVSSGSVNFMGKVNLKLVYQSENGEIESLNCCTDFNEYYENDNIEAGDNAIIELKVVDVTTPSIKSNEVKIACILDAGVFLSKNCIVQQPTETDGVLYKKEFCETTKQVASIKDNFDVQEDFRIDDDLKCVLDVDGVIAVKDCYAGSDFVVVSGEAIVNILYEDEKGNLKTHKANFAVKQEISVNGVNKDCIVRADMCFQSYLSKVSVVQEDNYNTVKWEVPVQICGVVYESALSEKIIDVYSLSNMVEARFCECETITNLLNAVYEDTVKGETLLKENTEAKFIANVFDCVEVSNATISNGGKIVVDGVISTTILYSDTENSGIKSVIAEIPFVTEFSLSEFEDTTEIDVKANIISLEVGVAGNSIQIIAKLQFNIFGTRKEFVSSICEIKSTGERELRDCSMEIAIVQDEKTLWDIGKRYGVSSEQIILQNPNITEPLSKGDKIVLYYSINER